MFAQEAGEQAEPVLGQLRRSLPRIGGPPAQEGERQLVERPGPHPRSRSGPRIQVGPAGVGVDGPGPRQRSIAARPVRPAPTGARLTGSYGQPRGHRGNAEGAQPGPEVGGGLPGERADHGVISLSLAIPDPPGYPQGEDPGLAGAGPGQHAYRGSRLIDSLPL